MNAIPTGFALCNGSTANGVATPDLRNKFIAGGSNIGAAAAPTTTVSGTPTATGGSASHTHGGATGPTTLTTAQIPQHQHPYKDGYFMEINNPGTGNGGTIDGADYVGSGGVRYKGSGDSDTDNKYIYYRNLSTSATGGGSSHTHTIPTSNTVPPFFALAYIMFVGS